uniref:Uncharacterized protein n=1 Tax=Romanomermis culicivorax TaxID=13658 RepID=A0A915KBH6_ROMCU
MRSEPEARRSIVEVIGEALIIKTSGSQGKAFYWIISCTVFLLQSFQKHFKKNRLRLASNEQPHGHTNYSMKSHASL